MEGKLPWLGLDPSRPLLSPHTVSLPKGTQRPLPGILWNPYRQAGVPGVPTRLELLDPEKARG